MEASRRVTIGLFWHSLNSDNLGVGALTLANIDILRRAARQCGLEPHFLVLGWRDPRPLYLEAPDVENRPFRTRDLVRPGGKIAADVRRCDIVFDIGGGDSFADIYGLKRFFTLWISKMRVIAAGKPLVLSPQTIGPFDKWWSRPLARIAMNRSRAIFTRDDLSTRFLEDLGIRRRVVQCTDVAMGLPYEAPPRKNDGKVRIGLNVSGLLFNGGYSGKNQFSLKCDYPSVVRRLIQRLSEHENAEIHLIGHVQSRHIPVEDDQRVAEQLQAEHPHVRVAPVFSSPIEAKSYIAGMDFFIGARMHATIAALSSGVPVTPMAYSRKFVGVFRTVGYDHVCDCRELDDDSVLEYVTDRFARRAELKRDAERARDKAKEILVSYQDEASQELRRATGGSGSAAHQDLRRAGPNLAHPSKSLRLSALKR
ncbi:polysaccharide pyruvyl transferase family protein [Oceanicella actignis]|uniref:Polysaccharide pyruvyl transferase family protein WcaK n=1 Tax=Oceanicella actignis TaxID=1189325 RepID=A0A1M7TDW3_9RHOB|nr:polysaccharide pyruvyl transferase family protein [Oceanicella actignis]SET62970.1 Polysaccharide pyruvyl transferase family protein WcaK [Oceanicella actignis]SHN68920.1 Polysaccharide pyruvyl transferase family protein WcaK [Oceanicella actignis]